MMDKNKNWLFADYEEYIGFLSRMVELNHALNHASKEAYQKSHLIGDMWTFYESALSNRAWIYSYLSIHNKYLEKFPDDFDKSKSIYDNYFPSPKSKETLKLEILRFLHIQILHLLTLLPKEERKGMGNSQLKRIKDLDKFYSLSRYKDKNEYSLPKVIKFLERWKGCPWSWYLLCTEVPFTKALIITQITYSDFKKGAIALQASQIFEEIKYPYMRLCFFEETIENGVTIQHAYEKYNKETLDIINDFIDTVAREFLMHVLVVYASKIRKSGDKAEMQLLKMLEQKFLDALSCTVRQEKLLLKTEEIKKAEFTRSAKKMYVDNLYCN